MPNPYSPLPDDTKPYQPPTLQQRISNALNALFSRPEPAPAAPPVPKDNPETQPQVKTQDDPAGRALPDANYVASYYRNYVDLMGASTLSRRRRYLEYDSMDTGYISAILDAIVDACLVSDDGQVNGFKVQAKNKMQNVLDQLIEDTNLRFFIRTPLREMLKYGDSFIGAVMDAGYNIVNLDNPPPSQMWAFVDQHMRLLTGTETLLAQGGQTTFARAYQQKNDALTTLAAWHPFEMWHLKYKPSKRLIYSEKSYLEDMRADWYKIRLIEESLVLHRVTRAAPRLIHMVDVTGKPNDEAETAVGKYLDMLRNKKVSDGSEAKNTMAVDEDIVLTTNYRTAPDGKLYPALNAVQHLDPRNTGLTQLPDVDYLTRKLFSRIPSEIVGILSDREDISTQDIAASRFYAYMQQVLAEQWLRPMFDLALLLKGFRPERGDYEIVFPNVQLRASWRFADAQFRQSMADANDVATGITTRKSIAQSKYGYTDAEWDDNVEQYKKEQPIFAPPVPMQNGNGGTSGKVAPKPKATQTKQIRGGQNST